MFLVALAFLGGHCVEHALPSLPMLGPWLLLPTALVVLAAVALRGAQRKVATALLLGGLWAWTHAAWRLDDALVIETHAAYVDVEVIGRIASLVAGGDAGASGDASAAARDHSVHFAVDVLEAERTLPNRIELSWYDINEQLRRGALPQPGELWRLRARLRAPRGFANPGGVDYEGQLFRKGVGATGYVRTTKRDIGRNVRVASAGWRYPVLRTRGAIAAAIDKALPGSSMVGIVQGLSVGDTQRIGSQQWRVFANTGTTHLMAISGLHVAMVAALGALLAGWLARRLPLQGRRIGVQDVQSLAGLASAVLYSALAGMSVPTQRTLVMLLVYFGTRLLRRQVGLTQSLGLALIGVLAIDPFAPLSPGFWLSFGAVAAIFLATGGRVRVPQESPKYRLIMSDYMQMQAAVSVGLLPFLIGAFGSLSLISPLVNLLAIPFFTLALVPTVLLGTLLLGVYEPLGAAVLHCAAWLLETAWPSLEWASRLPLATWHLPQLPWWAAVAMLVGCLVAIAPGMWATRSAGVMVCLPALLWQPNRPDAGEFELAVLDVGQGLAVAVLTQSHVLVYDTGPGFRSGRDTGEMVVLPYLHSRGVRRIDTLMITHGDSDHAGGMRSVLAGIPVNDLVLGPSVRMADDTSGPTAQTCRAGQQWSWDGVGFQVLHPQLDTGAGDVGAGDNNSSCVLRVSGNGGSALLLGDIERLAEEQLLASGDIGHAEVVVVPHHGSRTSSTDGLVRASAPRYAIVSAGHGNQWGFPKQDVLARWRAVGAQTLKTADSGAIEIHIGKRQSFQLVSQTDAWHLHEYRFTQRAYWRR